ncbi:MAG TPA: DUF1800 domain-containing protein [Planctomycetota bacterium]|nr:DUF1800 domain-containing protein [Planctomycetota bacterium]
MPPRLSRRDVARRLVTPARNTTSGHTKTSHPVAPPPLSFPLHVLSRATFGANAAVVAEMQQMGFDSWLEWQLHPEAINDQHLEASLPTLIAPYANNAADIRMLARAVHSKRQLAWRMVYFLNNHFSTFRGDTQPISETVEDDTFFKRCFSDFATVLRLSATSPAMIDYLDSVSNIASSPNENYARELMELHTLGVNGGYTEGDVATAARVFTGWSRVNVMPGGTGTPVTSSYFQFRANRHDVGPKTLTIGWSTPGISGNGGYLEGFGLLDFLAAHPNTATRFVEKLCRYFVSDQPPVNLLARVRQVFVNSGGDLRDTVRAIFLDDEFPHGANVKAKVHDGFEFIVNAVRRLGISAPNLTVLNQQVGLLRSQPHMFTLPTGYPEIGPPWHGPGNVLPRWKFADNLVHNLIGGVTVPWSTIFPLPRPVGGAAWVSSLLARLVDSEVPATTVIALTVFMDGRLSTLPANPTLTQVLPHLRDLTSLVLRLPEAHLN